MKTRSGIGGGPVSVTVVSRVCSVPWCLWLPVPLWHWWLSSLLPVWGGVGQCGGIGSPGAVVPLCQMTLLASFPSLHHAYHVVAW